MTNNKFLLSEVEENRIFKEACNGYGFQEIQQMPSGIYCLGCFQIHKRPTKMYSNGSWQLCKTQVVLLFNPEE
jgi:hypothetical protein